MAEGGQEVALVSGGNHGVGLEIGRQLTEQGIAVILASRDEEEGQATAERLSDGVVVWQLTRIPASELEGSGILANSVSLGWLRADVGGSEASRSVDEAADSPVWAATLPKDGPTGGFFRDRQQIPW